MTTKEQVYNAKKMYHQAVRNYLNTVKKAVVEHRRFRLMDEASDIDGKPVLIRISNHYPSFDQVALNVNSDPELIKLIFHVVDGDNFYLDNTWVSEYDLSEDNLLDLFDYIMWDD